MLSESDKLLSLLCGSTVLMSQLHPKTPSYMNKCAYLPSSLYLCCPRNPFSYSFHYTNKLGSDLLNLTCFCVMVQRTEDEVPVNDEDEQAMGQIAMWQIFWFIQTMNLLCSKSIEQISFLKSSRWFFMLKISLFTADDFVGFPLRDTSSHAIFAGRAFLW